MKPVVKRQKCEEFGGDNIDIYFPPDINEEAGWEEVYYALDSATSDDVIRLHLNGYGGHYNVAKRIIRRLRTTQATTSALVEAECQSCHAMIAINCEYFNIEKHASLLFHFIANMGYNFHTIKAIRNNGQTIVENYELEMKDIMGHFLNEREMYDVLEGEDVRIYGSHCYDRATWKGMRVDGF